MKNKRKYVKITEQGDTIIITRDPLQLIKGVRRGTQFNTGTKVIKPKKGKGSYQRQASRRVDWRGPARLP